MTRNLALASLTMFACATATADTTPRCAPGTRCGPPKPPPTELVHPSVRTVVSTTIDGSLVRAVAGRDKAGAFVTLETIENDRIANRTAVRFDGVTDATQLDVIQLQWRSDKPGALVFHLGANIGGWICHLDRGSSTANCVIARGGGRPRT